MTLYLPIGPPACGKTFLRHLSVSAQVIKASAAVSTDDFREQLTDDWWNQEENAAMFAMVEKISVIRLRRGLDVWLDATNLSGTTPYVEAARTFGHDVISILFDTPKKVCLYRNAHRDHPVPWDSEDDPMLRMMKQWMNIKPEDLPGLVIPSSAYIEQLEYTARTLA